MRDDGKNIDDLAGRSTTMDYKILRTNTLHTHSTACNVNNRQPTPLAQTHTGI